MISVLINWIYVFAVTYITGYFILTKSYTLLKYKKGVCIASAVSAGLAFTTVYAGYFSIFYKVGVIANIILTIACGLLVYVDRKHYIQIILSIRNNFKDEKKQKTYANQIDTKLKSYNVVRCFFLTIIFIVILFFTTEGQFFSDSGYYHEQSIRWIEEFGVVRGSVHVLKRLAYNSCYFCQCALFSMRDLFGQSLHCLGGFYALFVISHAVMGFDKNVKINMLRIAPLVYFVLFCSEITSPASDFPLTFIVLYVAIRWFELCDENVDDYVPYALLSLFVIFIISIKLTVGCLVLIVIYPAITMIKEKKIVEVISFIGTGIGIILPYFIRNYLICGWLIYPFTKIDLFNPDWKIVADAVQADADEIKVWGRGMGQIGGTAADGIRTWLPYWWEYMSAPNRRFIISLVTAGVLYIIFRFIKLLRSVVEYSAVKRGIKASNTTNIMIHSSVFEIAVLFSLLYWFLESPLFRYGVAYILIALMYMLGDVLNYVTKKCSMCQYKPCYRVITLGIVLICLLPPMRSLTEYIKWDYECVRYMSDFTYFVKQEDYPKVEFEETDIKGIKFYYPSEELGEIGYHMFPALWYNGTDGIELRGTNIKDGFRNSE